MPASIIGNPAVVTGLYQAFNGKAAGYNTYTNNLAFAAQNGPAAYAAEIGKGFYTVPAATLADSVLKNVGIDNAVLEDALVQIFTAYPVQARGQIVLNLINLLSNLEADATYGAAATAWNKLVASNNAYSNNPTNVADAVVDASVQTLTAGADTLVGNIFNAPRGFTPGGTDQVNTLDDDDVLTGTGTNPTLNFSFVDDRDFGVTPTITPTLRGVETINVSVQGTDGKILDMQDAAGVNAINVSRVNTSGQFTAQNITSATANLSINNSNAPTGNISFTYLGSAVSANNDSTTLTLNNAVVGSVVVQENAGTPAQGFETINLVSSGASNAIGTLFAEDLQTLNISGTQNVTLGTVNAVMGRQQQEASNFAGGLVNVAGSLTAIDASSLTGNLRIHLGAELNAGLDDTSGLPVQMTVTGGAGNDTFVLLNGVNLDATATDADRIAGGAGTNTLVIGGNNIISALGTGATRTATVTNVQALQVLSGHDSEGGVVTADTATIDARAFDALATTFIRNEGQDNGVGAVNVSAAEGMTVNLNQYTDAQANAITLAHGTTGNSDIANNVINVTYRTDTTTNTAGVTIVDGVNSDPVFNFQLNAADAELTTITDNDTESNTVFLNNAGSFTQAGSTLTLNGGRAGQYFSNDSDGGTSAGAGGVSGYGNATNGAAGDLTSFVALTRDTAVARAMSNGVAGADRLAVENVAAGSYVGNVELRLGDLTRADGVSSMDITTGSGNDTLIFDAQGVATAGFTSGDTVKAGTGTDTIVIDGEFAGRIDVQTSEWDNLSGVDVVRLGTNTLVANGGVRVAQNAGAYYLAIDNDFISQTDAGNRLTIINNDGDLATDSENDAVIDLRGLAQNKWVTFVGANSSTGSGLVSSNRIILDDTSANQNMSLNGGDADTAVAAIGNNNVYEVVNTANVSINDLAQVRNFQTIDFTNESSAASQTLTLTLNDTVVGNLVDSNHTATATQLETLNIRSFDSVATASVSVLNINASGMTGGLHNLNIDASGATGNDTIVGSAGADVITGGAGIDTITTGLGSDRIQFTAANATATDRDVIVDFAAGVGGDVLAFDVSDVAAGIIAANTGAFSFNAAADNNIIVLNGVGYANFAAAELAVNGLNAATDDYVLVFLNTTTGVAEVWADADSAVVGAGVQLASLTGITTLGGVGALVAANFAVY
ncbi:beta strand repeat-containing protein [Comamonas granuli]|uniref:beta strand repeat-containing protein n=1 Tax=Comamonas granuli TaxID=290309 RepID=UPI000AAE1B51|nr:hypothetical protein [Comamonas granuli]